MGERKSPADPPLGSSAVQGYRSAINDLFRCYKVPIRQTFADETNKIVTGYSKGVAKQAKRNGHGKQHLSFDLYCRISRKLLENTEGEFVFAHAFMTLQWNLMCRSDNTVFIELGHMEWHNDALRVYFRGQKNDQDGARSKDPRHVYANPHRPAICPILALGLYFLCFPPALAADHDDPLKLFPGSAQAKRFNDNFAKVLRALDHQCGDVDAAKYGSHSLRKGASSFVTSGTTDGPSQVAVNLRAGWTLTSVEKSYFKYEKAGDQFVGRVVCGLPTDSTVFATLPPFFEIGSRDPLADQRGDEERARRGEAQRLLSDVLTACFPGSEEKSGLRSVLEMLLASVVHHREWLREALPPDHPVFQAVLIAGGHVDALAPFVVCRFAQTYDVMRPTGLPSTVSYMLQVKKVQDECMQIRRDLGAFVGSFSDELRKGLNEYALDQGNVSYDTMRTSLDGVVRTLQASLEAKFSAILAAQRGEASGGTEESAADESVGSRAAQRPTDELYMWGGGIHRVPEDFQLPSGTVRQAFLMYAAGNAELEHPPLMVLNGSDMSTTHKKKRFSELRSLMVVLVREAQSEPHAVWPKTPGGAWEPRLTMAQAATVYEAVKDAIALPARTPKGRRRRREQLRWTTHARQWVEVKKRRVQRQENAGEDGEETGRD